MQKKDNPIINILTEKLLFLGGVTRSGKSFLCPIISSLKKTEMFICDSVAENVYYLNFLNMIKYDQAKYLFKHMGGFMGYEFYKNKTINRHLRKKLVLII